MRNHQGCHGVSPSIVDTAQFRALLEIDAADTRRACANEQNAPEGDPEEDSLVITARLPRLEIPESDLSSEFELNPGFDPYNNGPDAMASRNNGPPTR